MNSHLSDHLRDMASRPFTYGETDCAMFCALWIRRVSGIDVTVGLRADDADHAERITRGDLVSFAAGMMEAAGFAETDAPMRGDVGVVRIDGVPRCAIRLADKWSAKTPKGVWRGDAEMLAAWSIPVTVDA